MKRESPNQATFYFEPTITPRGDGTFTIQPGRPIPGRKKLTPLEAEKISGLSSDTIIRLYKAEMIEGEQPSPRKYFIYEDSLQAHLARTRDREFWESKNKQTYLKAI
jgi:hypothetical protein